MQELDLNFDPTPRTLAYGELLRIRDGQGGGIAVFGGVAWVTQESDLSDHVLVAGESFAFERPGLTIVEAVSRSGVLVARFLPRVSESRAAPSTPLFRTSLDWYHETRHRRALATADAIARGFGALCRLSKRLVLLVTLSGCSLPTLKQQPVECTFVVLITRGISNCASTPLSSRTLDEDAKRFSPAAAKANLYIVRPGLSGAPFLWKILIDGKPAGALAVQTYLLLEIEPGPHQITAVTGENQQAVAVDARRGENHFLALAGGTGRLEPRVEVREIEQAPGRTVVRSSRRVEPLRVAPPVQAPASAPGTSSRYVDPNLGWSVTYPGGWRLDDGERRFVKLGKGEALIGIHTGSGVLGLSLDRYADDGLRAWAARLGNVFVQISRRRVTLSSGLEAIEVIHHIGTGVVGKSRKVIFIVKDRGFWIDAEAVLGDWPALEREVDAIVDSFDVQE